jgi:hypothetical protein
MPWLKDVPRQYAELAGKYKEEGLQGIDENRS